MFKHILLSPVLVNNRVIVIENKQKIFQLQLQLKLQENCVINYNFVNSNYNFSKPAYHIYWYGTFYVQLAAVNEDSCDRVHKKLKMHDIAQIARPVFCPDSIYLVYVDCVVAS